MDDLARALREHFGFEQFRPGQREVIEHVLARRHTLALLPTGLGKSLCYQLPAQALPGLTIVISPAHHAGGAQSIERIGAARAGGLHAHGR